MSVITNDARRIQSNANRLDTAAVGRCRCPTQVWFWLKWGNSTAEPAFLRLVSQLKLPLLKFIASNGWRCSQKILQSDFCLNGERASVPMDVLQFELHASPPQAKYGLRATSPIQTFACHWRSRPFIWMLWLFCASAWRHLPLF